MDAHISIVTDMFDEVTESLLTERDVLVVGVILAAQDEINRLELELLMQLKLEIERNQWSFRGTAPTVDQESTAFPEDEPAA